MSGGRQVRTKTVREDVYDVIPNGYGFAVTRNEAIVSGDYSCRFQAGARMDKLKSNGAKVERKCMSCENAFVSEGIHNRICYNCATNKTGGMD